LYSTVEILHHQHFSNSHHALSAAVELSFASIDLSLAEIRSEIVVERDALLTKCVVVLDARFDEQLTFEARPNDRLRPREHVRLHCDQPVRLSVYSFVQLGESTPFWLRPPPA